MLPLLLRRRGASLVFAMAALLALPGMAETTAVPDLTQALATSPKFDDIKISPDGQYLAIAGYQDNKRALLCLDRSKMKVVGGIKLGGKDEVGQYWWVNNERLVFQINTREPWQKEYKNFGELYGVNCDGSKKELLFGYRVGDDNARKEARFAWAEIIHLLPNEPKHVLISSVDMSDDKDAKAKIYKMNVYTGQLSKTGESPIGFADILADNQGEPRVAAGMDKDRVAHVYIRGKDGDWTETPSLKDVADFTPYKLASDQSGFYFSGRVNNDHRGMYRFDFADNSFSEIYTPDGIDMSAPLFNTDGNGIYAMEINNGLPAYAILDKTSEDAQVFKALLEQFSGYRLNLTSRTQDGNLWVLRASGDTAPGTFLLFDKTKKQVSQLLERKPDLADKPLAQTQPVQFASFDKTTINGYLTQPVQPSAKKPLVVLIHGGPYGVRDYWQFDPEVQVIANAGYSVLQVNYRGSTGYGQQFSDAADLHWGDHVQQDIIAGVKWAVAQGHANADNICIVGGSFGGYSALQSASLAPELFKCAVGVAGIYDLNLMYSKGDIKNLAYGESYLETAIGKDEAKLKAMSPVYHADNIKASVLLIHGKHDKRAPLAHAQAMQEALEKAQKQSRLVEFSDETHGFYADENQLKYFQLLREFLGQHLQR